MTTTTKKITIKLSDAAPVTIDPDKWPIIARAAWHDGAVECQANHVHYLRVRQHADGRAIVYAARESGPGGTPRGFRPSYAGFLVPASADVFAEIIRTIRRTAGAIDLAYALANECIQDLPADELK